MNEHLIADLGRFVDDRHVTMSETPGHVTLAIVRLNVSLSILIPRGVLEWWVDVSDASSGMKIQDWCDYAGHAATADRELSEDMRTDVVRFIENVLARPLRVTANGRVLEWHVADGWRQAVPLVPQDEERAADRQNTVRATRRSS